MPTYNPWFNFGSSNIRPEDFAKWVGGQAQGWLQQSGQQGYDYPDYPSLTMPAQAAAPPGYQPVGYTPSAGYQGVGMPGFTRTQGNVPSLYGLMGGIKFPEYAGTKQLVQTLSGGDYGALERSIAEPALGAAQERYAGEQSRLGGGGLYGSSIDAASIANQAATEADIMNQARMQRYGLQTQEQARADQLRMAERQNQNAWGQARYGAEMGKAQNLWQAGMSEAQRQDELARQENVWNQANTANAINQAQFGASLANQQGQFGATLGAQQAQNLWQSGLTTAAWQDEQAERARQAQNQQLMGQYGHGLDVSNWQQAMNQQIYQNLLAGGGMGMPGYTGAQQQQGNMWQGLGLGLGGLAGGYLGAVGSTGSWWPF